MADSSTDPNPSDSTDSVSSDALEILKITLPPLTEKRNTLPKNVVPYFITTTVAVLTLFDFGQRDELVTFEKFEIFGGVSINSPRLLVIYILSLFVWVYFIRFGVKFYQSLDDTCLLIRATKLVQLNTVEENTTFLALLKNVTRDAYLVDAILIFYQKTIPDFAGVVRYILAGAVAAAFILFIGIGQFVTMLSVTIVEPIVGVILWIVYLSFYVIFIVNLYGYDIGEYTGNIGADGKKIVFFRRPKRYLQSIFIALCFLSIWCNSSTWLTFSKSDHVGSAPLAEKICFDDYSFFWAMRVKYCPDKKP